MGKVDILSRRFVSRNEVFADVVNTLEYGGNVVILPEMLHELDGSESQVIVTNQNKRRAKKDTYIEKFRDTIKSVCREEQPMKNYAIFGIEEQTEVHYGAPVKLLLYDALNYSNQIKRIANKHRTLGETPADGAEFLSGIFREDKLIPVKTLVVFFSSEPWNGPRCLHDMLDMEGWREEEKAMIPDYPLSILEPAKLTEDALEAMQSDLKLVMGFIKYSTDKDALNQYVQGHDGFHAVSKESIVLLNEVCSLHMKVEIEGKDVADVCKAIEDMKNEARQIGWNEGREENSRLIAKNLLKLGLLSISVIAQNTGLSITEVEALAKE